MRKIVSVVAATLVAATLSLASPATAAPIKQDVCVQLPGMQAMANFQVAQTATAEGTAAADLGTKRGALDLALGAYMTAVANWIIAVDTGLGNVAVLQSVAENALAAVGLAGASWTAAFVNHQNASFAADSAELTKLSLDTLFGALGC